MSVIAYVGVYVYQHRALLMPRDTRVEPLVSWHQERIEIQFQAWLCALAQAAGLLAICVAG